jgi:uncharacterized protein
MLDEEAIDEVRRFAIENSTKDEIHGFDHVERVYNMALKIGNKLKANMDLLKISVLLHDIGRIDEKFDDLKRNHADISAEKAHKFLVSSKIDISGEDVKEIIHCIKAHSFSNNIHPQTLEAKILSDLDKLDALGAIGLYRTIGFTIKKNGGLDQVIKHLENKILMLKELMYLDITKEIAEERELIIQNFYKKILKQR